MLMSYEKEGRLHLVLALTAGALSVALVSFGHERAALSAMFTVGWSAAHAFVLLLRKLRPL